MNRSPIVATILKLFAEHGDSEYGGEPVSQRDHALQTAFLARESGAPASLIAAALLHDIGHLLHNLPDDAPEAGIDDHHEDLGQKWLSRWFPANVVEPVRMHVAAKRYLCAVDPSYRDTLSESSLVSLRLQGGPMSAREIQEFEASPHFQSAVKLRRWDDQAKIANLPVPGIETYIPDLEATH